MNASPAATGLGSFALDNDQIYEYEKSVGDAGGIADLGAIRERMEKLGRFGDDTLAHVETGELVVPKPLLDKMPELKESIFDHKSPFTLIVDALLFGETLNLRSRLGCCPCVKCMMPGSEPSVDRS